MEQIFRVPQARHAFICKLVRFFDYGILMACIILYNMIVEDERHSYLQVEDFVCEQSNEISQDPISD